MNWEKVKLGDILTESKILCENPNPDRRIKVKLKVLGVEKRGLENEIEGATKQFIRKSGQFIYGKQNFHKGAFGIIPKELDGFESSADLPAFDVAKNCLPEWVFFFFKQGNFYLELSKIARGVATQRIHPEQIYDLEIPLPDIETQKEYLSNINAVESKGSEITSELTHQLSLLSQLRQSFLREAMQGRLLPQNPSDGHAKDLLANIKSEKAKLGIKEKPLPAIKPEDIPFEIPGNWVWFRLGDMALRSEAGKSFKCEEVPISFNEWGVIKVSAVSWDIFQENQNKIYSKNEPDDISAKINVGDFLISRANTSELVGKSVVVKSISKNLLLSDKTIRFIFSDLVSTDFINLCNNSKHARLYYASKGTGSSPSMKNITREHMKSLLIPLPPLPEQHRIVAKLAELMQTCDALEASIKQSKEQNEKLLQQVLREALQNN